MNNTDDAKKVLTPEEYEQYIQALLVSESKNFHPYREQFIKHAYYDIYEMNCEEDEPIDYQFEIADTMLANIVSYKKDGFVVKVEADYDSIAIYASKDTMDEDAYNSALEQYKIKSTEIEKAKSMVSYCDIIISERKESLVEPTQPPIIPNLPTDVAELQAMVMELMGKFNNSK